MEPIWFVLVAVMITAYVVLDGFDLGAGVVASADCTHRRRTSHRDSHIGPVWDGNEVWLIAGGGTLYLRLSSALCLQLQRLLPAAEDGPVVADAARHRNRISHAYRESVWQSLFDGFFAISSALLAIFFGAALGNVVRGVPLGADTTSSSHCGRTSGLAPTPASSTGTPVAWRFLPLSLL